MSRSIRFLFNPVVLFFAIFALAVVMSRPVDWVVVGVTFFCVWVVGWILTSPLVAMLTGPALTAGRTPEEGAGELDKQLLLLLAFWPVFAGFIFDDMLKLSAPDPSVEWAICNFG